MRIRKATLDDVEGIVEVHTAREDLSGLSVEERYLRGGPWMSIETLAIHLNDILLDNQLIAVAEINGKIIGEVEVLFSEEPVRGELRRIAHVDVIEVHPDYRGMGVGSALMEFVEDVAVERGAELLTVQPDKEAEGFYGKLGFDELLYDGLLVEIPTANFGPAGVTPLRFFPWETVKSLQLVAGHVQSSYDMWFSSFKDLFAGIHELSEAGKVGDSYYVLKALPGRPGKVALFLWGGVKDVPGAIGRAGELDFERVLTILDEGTTKAFEAEEKGKIPIIGKRIEINRSRTRRPKQLP